MDLRISELLAMQRELQELHRGDWADVVPSTARAVEKALRRARGSTASARKRDDGRCGDLIEEAFA